MMTLRRKQEKFAYLVADLILHALRFGFTVTLGEVYRPPETAKLYAEQGKGIAGSLHCDRLAIDLNLFRDGKLLTTTDGHRQLGEWWEQAGIEHGIKTSWGGRFGDGGHYSVAHNGKK